MPIAPPPENQGSADDIISYPTDLMSEVALTILQRTQQAMQNHQQAWQAIQRWIEESAPKFSQLGVGLIDVRPYLTNVLVPHAQRLQASYEWQWNAAQTLVSAIEQIRTTDQNIARSFTPETSTAGNLSSHGKGLAR
ncbi:MAG TPA: hypothetical protein VKX46_09455 [Ktedonobacteraceae bacterium]|jgi:hypothetical protein|nr:hypothetical protein [Ktedonobacteraceae bacterium]HLI71164.1 hypothetical protein [Ktedonobacteraceae bacterium]